MTTTNFLSVIQNESTEVQCSYPPHEVFESALASLVDFRPWLPTTFCSRCRLLSLSWPSCCSTQI